MTRQEFYEKYGKVRCRFSGYYKYTFTYIANLPDGSILSISVGGNTDDIYRFEVHADDIETCGSIAPYQGSVYKNGVVIDSFYDY